MKAIADDLAEQVCSVEIDLSRTLRLGSIFHRSLARRVTEGFQGAERSLLQRLLPQVRRLPSAAVSCVYRDQIGELDAAEAVRWFREAAEPRPAEVYDGPTDPRWLRDGVQEVLRSLNWGEEQVASVVTVLPPEVVRSLELARRALSTCWPRAWDEHRALVQYLVFTRGPLRSATIQSTYGIVYAEVEEAGDPLRMFELLLHESAHHTLALREQFTRFVENPEVLGRHALRSDPRPLRGVLHAAFVMCRIAGGISRYQRTYPEAGPLDGCAVGVGERMRFALDSLGEALEVLDASAVWTDDGRLLRESMGRCLAREGVPA